jgi:pSer/pThr/pTyr-binding forkhead associated (FHA) protein
MCPAPRPVPIAAAHDHTATRLETDEDVLNALKASLTGPSMTPPAIPGKPAARGAAHAAGTPTPAETPSPARSSSANHFRPWLRPPMAVLTVFDDGKQEGEQIRVRGPRFVIGRVEGDLIIEHDNMISSKHVEITRQQVGGQWRWVVTDLQSTNGMFVRVLRTALQDKSEILIGKGRYRFLAPTEAIPATVDHAPVEEARNSTQAWADDGSEQAIPALMEMIGSAFGPKIMLPQSEYWIGADPRCQICRSNDPYCEARHARLFRDEKGRWQAENNKSVNGLWFRLPQVVSDSTIQFQIGEQRFKLQIGT